MSTEYLYRILKARVYDVAIETPLERAPRLSVRFGNEVLFKREDLQPVFSFKLRGAYNKLVQIPPDELARGVICASAGNHAQGVALAAGDSEYAPSSSCPSRRLRSRSRRLRISAAT